MMFGIPKKATGQGLTDSFKYFIPKNNVLTWRGVHINTNQHFFLCIIGRIFNLGDFNIMIKLKLTLIHIINNELQIYITLLP